MKNQPPKPTALTMIDLSEHLDPDQIRKQGQAARTPARTPGTTPAAEMARVLTNLRRNNQLSDKDIEAMEAQAKQRKREEVLRRSGLPRAFYRQFMRTGEGKPLEKREHLEGAQTQAFGDVCGYLQGNGAIVIICGDMGHGKSHIARNIVAHWIMNDLTATYGQGLDLVQQFGPLYAMGRQKLTQENADRDHWAKFAAVRVIDEAQELFRSNAEEDRMITDLLDRRYQRKRDTVLAMNGGFDEVTTMIPARLLSRMEDHGGIVELQHRNMREN